MSANVLVRPVVGDDYDQWLPLWDGYNAFYGRSGPTALAAEITAMTWSRFFDAYEPMHALVAESEGELLGLTHYLFHRSDDVDRSRSATSAISSPTKRRAARAWGGR